MAEKTPLYLLLTLLLTACGSPESGSYEQALGKRFVPTDGIVDVIDTGVTGGGQTGGGTEGGQTGGGESGGGGNNGGGGTVEVVLAPQAPSSVIASISVSVVTLRITDVATNETRYEIIRRSITNMDPDRVIYPNITPQSGYFTIDDDLADGGFPSGDYQYIVRAVNDGGAGQTVSNTVSYNSGNSGV